MCGWSGKDPSTRPGGLAQDDRGEAGADSPGVDDEGEPVMPPTNGRRYGEAVPLSRFATALPDAGRAARSSESRTSPSSVTALAGELAVPASPPLGEAQRRGED